MNFLGMGPLELLLILALALVVFGPEKLPDLARQLGRVVAEVRRVSTEVSGEIQRGLQLDEPRIAERPSYHPPSLPPVSAAPYTPAAPPAPAPTPTPPSEPEEIRPPY